MRKLLLLLAFVGLTGPALSAQQGYPQDYIILADVVLPLAIGTGASPITLSLVPSRTSCAAPCMVFFDATSTTDTNVAITYPIHEIEYRWEFGDSTGTWGDQATGAVGAGSISSRSTERGPVAAHVFGPDGTGGNFTVTLTGYDGTNTTSTTQLITVTAADTQWAGAGTTCVNASGAVHTGCNLIPGTYADSAACIAASRCVTQSDWPTIISTYATAGKRVLLKGGDIFTGVANTTLTAAGPGYIGSYGTGQAIIRTTGTTSGSKLIKLNTGASDWRFTNLAFHGQSDTDAANGAKRQFMTVDGSIKQLTLLRLNIHDIGAGVEIPCSTATAPLHDQLALVDSTISKLNSDAVSTNTHGVLTCSSQTAFLGNLFDDSVTLGSAEHLARFEFIDRGVIAHNQIQKVRATKEMLTVRAPCGAACPTGSANYFPAVLIGTAAASRKFVISDNFIKTNTYVGIALDQVNNNDSTVIQDAVIERNYCQNAAGNVESGVCIEVHGNRVSIRNNLADVTNGTAQTGLSIDAATAGMAASDLVWMYNNTIVSNSASAFTGFNIPAGSTNTAVKNTLAYAPLSASRQLIGGAATTGAAGTFGNSSNAQILTNPNLTLFPPLASTDFKITGAGYDVGGGVSVLVWSDFFLVTEPSPRDIGAVIH